MASHEAAASESGSNDREATDLDAVVALAERRKSIRGFLDEPVPDDVLYRVLEAANHAPSAANSQPWEFVVVHDQAQRERIGEAFREELEYKKDAADPDFPALGYTGFANAPVAIVLVGDTRYQQWWPHLLDGSREKMFQHSIAAAMMSLQLAAAAAGLGTVWNTTRRPTQSRLSEILDLPDYCRAVLVTPLGYPTPEQQEKSRSKIPVEYKIHEDTLDRDRLPTVEEIAEGKTKDNWLPRTYHGATARHARSRDR